MSEEVSHAELSGDEQSVPVPDPLPQPVVSETLEQPGQVIEPVVRLPLGAKSDSDSTALKRDAAAVFLSVDVSFVTNIPDVVLQKIAARASELEALKSQKLLDDVSYEQSLHAANAKVSVTKQRLDDVTQEVQQLEEKVVNLEKEKLAIRQDLSEARDQDSGNNDSVRSLQQRLETVTSDKRHLFETLERRSGELRELRSELEAAHSKSLESRKRIVELENQAQQDRSVQMSFKLKEQSLSQEIELLKRSNGWLDSELAAKSEEFKKFRTERLSKLSSLQSEFDSLQASNNSLVKSHDSLQARFDEISGSYDNSLVKIKDLQNAQVVAEESFRSEMTSQQRLTELWERSANEAKSRVEELQRSRQKDQSNQAAEMARWKAEAEKARKKAGKLEGQIKILETRLETVFSQNDEGAGIGSMSVPSTPGSQPQTPSRNGSSNVGIFSPSAQIISKIQKGGGSLVQLYSDLQETKTLLERERHKNEILRREMDNILEEMEDHAPIIMAEREEYRRLELELAELSTQLEKSTTEVDEFKSKLKVTEIKYKDSIKENDIISQQVRDLSRQVQHLLVQHQLETDSEAPLSPEEHSALQQLLNNPNDNASDTDKLISQRLVLFKDIIELQKQNENLLKITRDLGKKMELQEATRKKDYEDIESSAVKEAKKAIKTLQDDSTRLSIKYEAIKRERDMFRSMLKSGESTSELNVSTQNNQQVETLIKQNDEATEAVKQIEHNFATYRTETSVTIKTLNEQINSISNERSNLQIKIARVESQLELANERAKNSHNNLQLLQSENQEIKKRSQSLQDILSRQDMKTQKVAEELIDAKSLIDSVKNEASNLKAEKALWKSIESRITKENAELLEEKGRLNGLLKNVELLASEREASYKDTERRLTAQIETLEAQVSRLNQKLEAEEKELKTLSDRRDVDASEFRSKLDRSSKELKDAQEKLSIAEAKNVELNNSLNQLSSDFTAANEKLAIYTNSESVSTLESKLSEEITNLKRTLKEKEDQLASADKHIHDLTEVAAAAEEALGSLNTSHEEFTASINANIAKKDSEIANVKERLQVTTEILNSTSKELESIKNSEANGAESGKAEKEKLEATIAALTESETRLLETQEVLKKDLEQQAVIAKEAQDNYEKELVKHADAANTVQKLRSEVNDLKEQVVEITSKANNASAQLAASEGSWGSQKYSYEHEIEELKSRCEELSSQNKALLEQLENVSSRVSKIKSEGESSGGDNAEESSDDKLREIITYLKREKEIVECNYELVQQEARRLKQQLDHTVTALDEAKLDIEKERQRESDSLRIAADHAKVLQQLEDINVLRESNSSLRGQSKYYMNKTQELETELNAAKEKIEPLEDKLRESIGELETKEAQIKLIQEDNDKWKQRAQQILQKYQRIDPEELQALKDEVDSLKKIVSTLELEKNDLQQQLTSNNTVETKAKELEQELEKSTQNYTQLEGRFNRLKDESVAKLAKRRGEVAQLKEELTKSTTEVTQLKESLEATKKELESASSASGNLTANNDDQLTQLKSELEATKQALEAAKSSAQDITEKDKRISHLESEVNRLSDEAVELQRTHGLSSDETAAKLTELIQEKTLAEQSITELKAEIEKLQGSLAGAITDEQHQQKLNELKQQMELEKATGPDGTVTTTDGGSVNLEELKKQIKDEAEKAAIKRLKANAQKRITEITEARKVALEEQLTKTKAELEEQFAQKEEELKKQLGSSGNPEALNSMRQSLEKEFENRINALNAKHAEEIKKATQAGREAAAKEGGMRVQLLVKKAEKAEKEKEQLALQIRKLKGGEDIPTPQTTSQTNTTIPGINQPVSAVPKVTGGFARPTFASASASASNATTAPDAQSGIPTAGGRLRPPTSVAGVAGRPGVAPSQRPGIVRPGKGVRPGIVKPGQVSASLPVATAGAGAANAPAPAVPASTVAPTANSTTAAPAAAGQELDSSGTKRAASGEALSEQDQKRRKEENNVN